MRRLLVLGIVALLLAACGSDEPRPRTVDVTVSVVDGRNPADIEVVATGYVDVVREGFLVTYDDEGSAHLGDTCDEAIAGASRTAEALGTEIGPCEPFARPTTEVADRVTARTGADGVAVIGLLADLRYEFWAGVEIVPGDGDGCVWNGVDSIDEISSGPIALHLDSDGCSGG